jgi:hypothetical protein
MPFSTGTCTSTPNWLFDEVLRNGTCAQAKVTACVVRYTIGTGHHEAKLSDSFLGWCTGEGQLDLNRGIEEALKRGFICRRRFEGEWAYAVKDVETLGLGEQLLDAVFIPDRKGNQERSEPAATDKTD